MLINRKAFELNLKLDMIKVLNHLYYNKDERLSDISNNVLFRIVGYGAAREALEVVQKRMINISMLKEDGKAPIINFKDKNEKWYCIKDHYRVNKCKTIKDLFILTHMYGEEGSWKFSSQSLFYKLFGTNDKDKINEELKDICQRLEISIRWKIFKNNAMQISIYDFSNKSKVGEENIIG